MDKVYPEEMISTGISAIDTMNSIASGVGVDGLAVDIQVILRQHLGTLIDSSS
jgi:hypothetical protein